MVNVMGSCFDEAYTRFLTKEEHEFREQFATQMKESVRPSIRKSLVNQTLLKSTEELLLHVSKLNNALSEMIATSQTFRYDINIVAQMKKVADLLSIVICDQSLSTSKILR